TTINAGVLKITSSGTLSSGDVANNAALFVQRTDGFTLSNNISGSGAVYQTGTGTMVLAGVNSYTGGTYINTGSIRLASSDALPNGGDLTMSANTGLDLNGTNPTLRMLNSGGGSIRNNLAATTSTLTLGADAPLVAEFSGTIVNVLGTVALTKVGTGIEMLS